MQVSFCMLSSDYMLYMFWGGVIALIIMFFKSFVGKVKLYSAVPVELMATYWHFVDLLWIYLLIFFIIVN